MINAIQSPVSFTSGIDTRSALLICPGAVSLTCLLPVVSGENDENYAA